MMKRYLPFVLGLLVLSQACNDDDEPSIAKQEKEAIEVYAEIVYASYEDSYTTAEALKQKIDAFVTTPTAASLQQCKDAWFAARIPYGQTEAYRFYAGPIDNEEDGPEGLLNAWPMDESYIDYVQGDDDAGIINNTDDYPTISKALLAELNETTETSISTGYHAIEFLLWGQDLSADGAGERPHTDYISGASGTAANQQRRGQYLKAVAELLLDNLKQVRDAWAPGADYRETFVNETDSKVVMGYIFTALQTLAQSELAEERMLVALDEADQENEHSCFSDNTDVDIQMNFKGIKNVYFGSYKRVDGSTVSGRSFDDIIEEIDEDIADEIEDAFENAEVKIEAVPDPFDQAIISPEGSAKYEAVVDAIESLRDETTGLGAFLGEAAALLEAEMI